jgi:hypothetical protein
MNDKLDNIDRGEYYTIDYLKNRGFLSNENSVNRIFTFKPAPSTKLPTDNDVQSDSDTDTSPVVEAIYIWEDATAIQKTPYPSVFGDNIIAKRVAKATGKFDFGLDPDGVSAITQTGTAGYSIKGTTGYENRLAIFSGTTANSEIRIQDTDFLRYAPGYEFGVWFTAYFKGLATGDGKIELGLMDAEDGLGIAYKDVGNGQEFGMVVRHAGTETFVPQSSFNIDKADGTGSSGVNINFSAGNIFQIRAGYLGYAAPILVMLDKRDKVHPLHVVEYPNNNNGDTIISRTALPVSAYVTNGTTAENVEVQIGSYNAYVVNGESADLQNRPFAESSVEAVAADNTYKNIIAFKNKSTAQLAGMSSAKENRISARLTSLNVVFNGQSQAGFFRLIIIPSADIVGSFTDKDSNRSIMSIANSGDITSVDDTNAVELFEWSIPKTNGYELPSLAENVKRALRPGETAVFQRLITGGTTAEDTFNNTWDELH